MKYLLYAFSRESHDSIIRALLEEVSWKRLDERWNKILTEDEFIPLDKL